MSSNRKFLKTLAVIEQIICVQHTSIAYFFINSQYIKDIIHHTSHRLFQKKCFQKQNNLLFLLSIFYKTPCMSSQLEVIFLNYFSSKVLTWIVFFRWNCFFCWNYNLCYYIWSIICLTTQVSWTPIFVL